MLIFQLLALIILIPFTILLIIFFNIYLTQWVYRILIPLIGIFYAGLCGLLFNNLYAGIFIFIILTIFYSVRVGYLATLFTNLPINNYPVLRGKIKKIVIIFPFSFLRILKLLPSRFSKAIVKNFQLSIQLSDLVDQILENSRGTRIEIKHDDVDIFFEII